LILDLIVEEDPRIADRKGKYGRVLYIIKPKLAEEKTEYDNKVGPN